MAWHDVSLVGGSDRQAITGGFQDRGRVDCTGVSREWGGSPLTADPDRPPAELN